MKKLNEYIVVSYRPGNKFNNYYVSFDNKNDAIEFLHTEQYDFRERILYDCTDGLSQDFIDDWCYTDDQNDDDIAWDEKIEFYTALHDKTPYCNE